jgi:hypothetical protein
MDLNTIVEIKGPVPADEVRDSADGLAWLVGRTWLFSEPPIQTHTLWRALPNTLKDATAIRFASLPFSADRMFNKLGDNKS